MKQLVILSGKGGTGKTSTAAAFAHLASNEEDAFSMVIVDADVDAANLEFLLSPEIIESHEFIGGENAVIDTDLCNGCGTCEDVCRYEAVHPDGQIFKVDPIACEGCKACVYQCPCEAIQMVPEIAGDWHRSETAYGTLFHASLKPAKDNSGKLVTKVKQQAKQIATSNQSQIVLVDGPPGIGCPVISAVSGANLALIVTEPTAAGLSDTQRIYETTKHFDVPTTLCINKFDIYTKGTDEIEAFCFENGIRIVGKIPFDQSIVEGLVQGKPVTLYNPDAPASIALKEVWDQLQTILMAAK